MVDEYARNLQKVQTLLNRWNDANAKIWEYSVSHTVLVIRLAEKGRSGNLYLRCGDVGHISGPTSWNHALIKVAPRDKGDILISDQDARFAVIAGTVEAAENFRSVTNPPER